jgi:hypothetical protein
MPNFNGSLIIATKRKAKNTCWMAAIKLFYIQYKHTNPVQKTAYVLNIYNYTKYKDYI